MNIFRIAFAILLIAPSAYAAIENLDEMETRKARRATNTFYHGASAGNNLVRQPQSLMYSDTRTGHEVWVLSNNNNQANIFYTDISPANPWSADGARLGFFSSSLPSSYTAVFGSGLGPNGEMGHPYVMRSDGSYIRDAGGSANRGYGSVGFSFYLWSPVVPDVHYTVGGAYNGLSLERYSLYKNTVTDTATTYTKALQLSSNTSDEFSTRKSISPDGKVIPTQKGGGMDKMYSPAQVYPENEAQVFTATGWAEQRGQTDEWAGGDPFACAHDAYMPSSEFMVLLFSQDCNNVGPVFYKYNVTGTDADGGPDFDQSETTYATFNSKEVEPLWTAGSATLTNVPWKLEKTARPDYHWWGHPGFDRWGRTVTFNDGNGYWYPNGSTEYGGPITWDYKNRTLVAEPGATQPQVLVRNGGSYVDHNAWSDHFAYAKVGDSDPVTERWVLTAEYDKLADVNNWNFVAYHYGNQNGSGNYEWTSNSRVAQSPDGTKISYAITFLTSVPNSGDMVYAVAYYPHPPEITSVTNNSGTYAVRFDWRTDQATSRGYTQRGWPDESMDDPPPPRETKLFRLWRSATGTDGWVPVGTVNADIFSRYDFATGDWTGNKYWEISDTPGAGTWHYAVTAQEHSGLESRTLSNVFSTAGTQTAAYPSDPKGDSDFATVYNPTTVRHYNIYAADGTAPTATQQDRIASIPVAAAGEYVDWLGDTAGTTQYLVTAVDTQGNESGAVDGVTRTGLATPGQYKLQWGNAVPRRLSLGGSLIKLAEPGP